MRKKMRIGLYSIFYKWEMKFFSSNIITLPQSPDLHQYNVKLTSAIMVGTQILVSNNLLYLLAFKVLLGLGFLRFFLLVWLVDWFGFGWAFSPKRAIAPSVMKSKFMATNLFFLLRDPS